MTLECKHRHFSEEKGKSKNFSWFLILFGLKFTLFKVNASSS